MHALAGRVCKNKASILLRGLACFLREILEEFVAKVPAWLEGNIYLMRLIREKMEGAS